MWGKDKCLGIISRLYVSYTFKNYSLFQNAYIACLISIVHKLGSSKVGHDINACHMVTENAIYFSKHRGI